MHRIIDLNQRHIETLASPATEELREQGAKELLQMIRTLRAEGLTESTLHKFCDELDAFLLRQQALAYRHATNRSNVPESQQTGHKTPD